MYHFTGEQLNRLLFGVVDMFFEYRNIHGRTEDAAKFAAVREIFEGLDAERELAAAGEYPVSLQTILPETKIELASSDPRELAAFDGVGPNG